MGVGGEEGFMMVVVVERRSWSDDEDIPKTDHAHFWRKAVVDGPGVGPSSGPQRGGGGGGGGPSIEAEAEIVWNTQRSSC